MKVNRFVIAETFCEVVAVEHLRDGDSIAEVQNVCEREPLKPVSVAVHLGLVEVHDLADLGEVVLRIFLNLVQRQPAGAGFVAATGVADQGRVISDDDDCLVAELLKLLHLFQRHGVAKMDVDAGRVDTVFDPQRRVRLETFLQFRGEFFFRADLLNPAANDGKLLFNGRKRHGGNDRKWCRFGAKSHQNAEITSVVFVAPARRHRVPCTDD